MQVHKKQWDVHMRFFIPIYYLFGVFENMARDLLGLDHASPLFSKVMAGFDSSAFHFNRDVWGHGEARDRSGLWLSFSSTRMMLKR